MKVSVYHNVLWSKYKAVVFSALHKTAIKHGDRFDFVQIAETELARVSLASVDLRYHQYPFQLLYKGAYDKVSTWRLSLKLILMAWRSDADLVILPGFHRPEYFLMLAALVFKRRKRAVFCDSTLLDRRQLIYKRILKKIFFSMCHGYFTYGYRGAQYLVYNGADPGRIFFRFQSAALPLGYSVTDARQRRYAASPRPEEEPRFLYVGRFAPEKGLDTLLRAFTDFREHSADSTLTLVGAGPDEALLRQLVVDLGIQASVRFAGAMDLAKLADEYSSATCLILPSRSEPWGLVVNEAFSYGCPAIVSEACGCMPDLIVEGVTGFSFKTDDRAMLVEKMKSMASKTIDVHKMADQCFEHISHYTPEQAAEMLRNGCLAVLEGK